MAKTKRIVTEIGRTKVAKKTPQEIMTCIADFRAALIDERRNVAPGTARDREINACLANLADVLNEIIAKDLHSRTARLDTLRGELVDATQELDELKENIQSIIGMFNTVQAIVRTATALLPFL